jgi:NADH-quinone oxidoreductase subunit G
MVTIEIDGQELKAKAGAMLIDVADEAGIHIPRFCYHKKLSVSANCRMCLVEVEKVPRPLPACATPVNDGMKVKTRSSLAVTAQQGTMEFLLINHPLDCPICDQGGECELQDVAVGYGSDACRYVEGKRVVADKNIGPLVATDLTRCIQCTRCVRFGAEIAGIRELGATGRGEHMQIGTYIEKSVDSELSGNIIDVCPVGSLTSKPFRFRARAWELVQRDAIAPHDSVGSNVHIHLRNGEIMRVVPKENEAVNECWLSDRDRYSFQGVYADDRLTRPMIKKDGEWQEVEWKEALEATANGLKNAAGDDGDQLAALISPNSTQEEAWLASKLLKGLGSDNIDYRLRQGDFRTGQPDAPWLGMGIADLEGLDAVLIVGANPRLDQPLLGHRLRKAAMKGAKVTYINPLELDLNYRASQWVTTPAGMIDELAGIGKGLNLRRGMIAQTKADDRHKALAAALKEANKIAVLLGPMALAHPDASLIWGLADAVAESTGATLGLLPEAANSTGVGLICDAKGQVQSLLERPRKGYLLCNLEPGLDLNNPALAATAFEEAEFVVALSAFRSESLETAADVLLPMATFGETSGTFVNAAGQWQSFAGATKPQGEARPGWKILRVLGNLLELAGFDQDDCGQVLEEIRQELGDRSPQNKVKVDIHEERRMPEDGMARIGDLPIYASDALVRRAMALQETIHHAEAAVRINTVTAKALGVEQSGQLEVSQGDAAATLPAVIDDSVPDNCARVQAGLKGTETLGAAFGVVSLKKA